MLTSDLAVLTTPEMLKNCMIRLNSPVTSLNAELVLLSWLTGTLFWAFSCPFLPFRGLGNRCSHSLNGEEPSDKHVFPGTEEETNLGLHSLYSLCTSSNLVDHSDFSRIRINRSQYLKKQKQTNKIQKISEILVIPCLFVKSVW